MFTDEDFVAALREYADPEEHLAEGWEIFADFDDKKIYRQCKPSNPHLYEYLAFGRILTSSEILSKVYLDADYRAHWDKYCVTFRLLCATRNVFQYRVKYPWPMANREYFFRGECRHMDCGAIVYLGKTLQADELAQLDVPARAAGVVRCDAYHQVLIMRNVEPGVCRLTSFYSDDPKGHIPTPIINWAASTGVPSFFGKLESACVRYTQWCQDRDEID